MLLPLRGVSAIDAEGKPFWWPEADRALFEAIRAGVLVVERDQHINDPKFAIECAETLLGLIAEMS